MLNNLFQLIQLWICSSVWDSQIPFVSCRMRQNWRLKAYRAVLIFLVLHDSGGMFRPSHPLHKVCFLSNFSENLLLLILGLCIFNTKGQKFLTLPYQSGVRWHFEMNWWEVWFCLFWHRYCNSTCQYLHYSLLVHLVLFISIFIAGRLCTSERSKCNYQHIFYFI